MKEKKANQIRVRQDFLLSFFDGEGYEEKEVNGFWLVKLYNGNSDTWQVAIYSQESYKNYKKFTQTIFTEQAGHIRSIK